MTVHNAQGEPVPLRPVLAKLAAYFAWADLRTASVADVVDAIAAGKVTAYPIPRCGALIREAVRLGLIEVEAVAESEGVR